MDFFLSANLNYINTIQLTNATPPHNRRSQAPIRRQPQA